MTTSRTTLPAFLTAEGLSLIADSAFLVVLPWLVLTMTNEPATASLVLAAAMVPAVVAGLVGGYVIDRFGRRRSSVVASVGSAAAVTALALFAAVDELTVTALIVFGLLANVFGTPALTARDALMADVARAGGVPIERVAGLRQAVFAIAFLGGPAAAGLLVAVVPAPTPPSERRCTNCGRRPCPPRSPASWPRCNESVSASGRSTTNATDGSCSSRCSPIWPRNSSPRRRNS